MIKVGQIRLTESIRKYGLSVLASLSSKRAVVPTLATPDIYAEELQCLDRYATSFSWEWV